eukprot:1670245-Pyramimonas_sp.AAC.1
MPILQSVLHPGSAMSLKAAEVAIMIDFATSQLIKHGGAARFGAALLGAGASLKRLRSEMAAHEGAPTADGMKR